MIQKCVLPALDTSSQAELSHTELLNRTEVPEKDRGIRNSSELCIGTGIELHLP